MLDLDNWGQDVSNEEEADVRTGRTKNLLASPGQGWVEENTGIWLEKHASREKKKKKGSVVMSTCCSSRAPMISFQHPYQAVQVTYKLQLQWTCRHILTSVGISTHMAVIQKDMENILSCVFFQCSMVDSPGVTSSKETDSPSQQLTIANGSIARSGVLCPNSHLHTEIWSDLGLYRICA